MIFLPRPLRPWCRARVTALVYEERYLEGKVQILGVSVEPAEEGKKFLERVTRDCEEYRLQIPLDPYPVRLLCDPDAKLIRAVGTENEGHSAGTIAAPLPYMIDQPGKLNGPTSVWGQGGNDSAAKHRRNSCHG